MENVTIVHLGPGAVYDPVVVKLRYIAEVWLTFPLIVFGIVGNCMSFVVLCHHRRQKLQTTTTLLQGLAVADTLVLANVFVLRTMRYLVHTSEFHQFHATVYPYLFPMFYVLRLINTWLTVLLTVDRYIATCRPLHAQHLCTMKRTYALVAAVVVASSAFCLPRFFENKTQKYDPTPLVTNTYYIIIYQIVLFLLCQYLVPMILLVVLNGFVVRALRRSTVYRASLVVRPMTARVSARPPPVGSFSRSSSTIGTRQQSIASVASIGPIGCGSFGGPIRCGDGQTGGARVPRVGARKSTASIDSTFESTRRVTIIVVVVVLLCIVCHTVAMLAQVLWSIQTGGFDLGESNDEFDLARRHVSQTSNVLLTLNSASNFVIYCMCSRNFRSILVRRFLCCFLSLCRSSVTKQQPDIGRGIATRRSVVGRGGGGAAGGGNDGGGENVMMLADISYRTKADKIIGDESRPVTKNTSSVTKNKSSVYTSSATKSDGWKSVQQCYLNKELWAEYD